MSKYDDVKEKLIQLHDLVVEHEESRKYESMEYHVVKTDPSYQLFALYRKSDGKQLVSGSPSRIRSYMNLRNIDKSNVYFDK